MEGTGRLVPIWPKYEEECLALTWPRQEAIQGGEGERGGLREGKSRRGFERGEEEEKKT